MSPRKCPALQWRIRFRKFIRCSAASSQRCKGSSKTATIRNRSLRHKCARCAPFSMNAFYANALASCATNAIGMCSSSMDPSQTWVTEYVPLTVLQARQRFSAFAGIGMPLLLSRRPRVDFIAGPLDGATCAERSSINGPDSYMTRFSGSMHFGVHVLASRWRRFMAPSALGVAQKWRPTAVHVSVLLVSYPCLVLPRFDNRNR